MTPMLSSIKSNRMSSVFTHNLHRYKSIWILYAILMFLLMPLALLLSALSNSAAGRVYIPTEALFHLLALGMSIALPLILFQYINNRQAVDVFHSLPVSRKNLFWGNYLFGLTVLLIPYLLFGGVTVAIQSFLNDFVALQVDYPLIFMAMICFYSTMVFIMVNCGTLFESITYFGMLHIGYPLFLSAGFSFVSSNTYGYPAHSMNIVSDILYSFSAARQLLYFYPDWQSYQWWKLLPLLFIAVIVAFLGAYLYQKRKSESAGQSFAYVPLFYIGSLLISITVGLGMSLALGGEQIYSYLLGILLGLITYFALDTIRNRGFRKIAQTAIVGCAAAVLATAFFAISNLTHTFGFETRIPAIQQVEGVQIEWDAPGSYASSALRSSIILSDRESIQRALDFHQSIVANLDTLQENPSFDSEATSSRLPPQYKFVEYTPYSFDDGTYSSLDYGECQVRITYTLQNGFKMYREYNRCPFVLTKPLYQIAQSEAYKQGFLQWLEKVNFDRFDSVSLYSNLCQGAVSYSMTTEQADDLKNAIETDIRNRDSSFHMSPVESPVGFLELFNTADAYIGVQFSVYPSDKYILSFLQRNAFDFFEPSIEEIPAVAYIPKEDRQTLMQYPDKTGLVFFCTGQSAQYDEWMPEKYSGPYFSDVYKPEFHLLTQEKLESLLTMITPIYFSETPHDVVILGGTNYLVYPQYEDQVRELIQSGALYSEEMEELPGADTRIAL